MKGLEIIVKTENTRTELTKNGTKLRKQQAAIEDGSDYPLRFELTVREPYKPGRYTISPRSFRVSQFGSLELNRYELELLPVG